jgi:hypothetical protein
MTPLIIQLGRLFYHKPVLRLIILGHGVRPLVLAAPFNLVHLLVQIGRGHHNIAVGHALAHIQCHLLYATWRTSSQKARLLHYVRVVLLDPSLLVVCLLNGLAVIGIYLDERLFHCTSREKMSG